MGSAALDAIVQGHISASFYGAISAAALGARLPEDSVPDLRAALAAGVHDGVGGATEVWSAVMKANHELYAHAYRLGVAEHYTVRGDCHCGHLVHKGG